MLIKSTNLSMIFLIQPPVPVWCLASLKMYPTLLKRVKFRLTPKSYQSPKSWNKRKSLIFWKANKMLSFSGNLKRAKKKLQVTTHQPKSSISKQPFSQIFSSEKTQLKVCTKSWSAREPSSSHKWSTGENCDHLLNYIKLFYYLNLLLDNSYSSEWQNILSKRLLWSKWGKMKINFFIIIFWGMHIKFMINKLGKWYWKIELAKRSSKCNKI